MSNFSVAWWKESSLNGELKSTPTSHASTQKGSPLKPRGRWVEAVKEVPRALVLTFSSMRQHVSTSGS